MKKALNIFILLTICTSGIFAMEKIYEKGEVSVIISTSPDKITLDQTINYQWQIKYPQTYQLDQPSFTDTNDFLIISDKENNTLDADGNITFSITRQLEPLTFPQLTLEPLRFTFSPQDPNQLPIHIDTDPITISITKTIDPNDPNVLAAAEEIQPVAVPPFKVKWWMFLPIVLVIIFTILLWLTQRKNAKKLTVAPKAPPIPPHITALEALKKLLAENLITQGKVKLFYQKLSDILRQYIERRFEINAPDLTTEEFMQKISTHDKLSSDDKQLLSNFLTQCDLVKFAKHQPEPQDTDKSAQLAKSFIEKTAQTQPTNQQGVDQ